MNLALGPTETLQGKASAGSALVVSVWGVNQSTAMNFMLLARVTLTTSPSTIFTPLGTGSGIITKIVVQSIHASDQTVELWVNGSTDAHRWYKGTVKAGGANHPLEGIRLDSNGTPLSYELNPGSGGGGGGSVATIQEDGVDVITGPNTVSFDHGLDVTSSGVTANVAVDESELAVPQANVTSLVTDLAAKAPLSSPTFAGNPAAPTPAAADNDTSLATSEFVQRETVGRYRLLQQASMEALAATITSASTWLNSGNGTLLAAGAGSARFKFLQIDTTDMAVTGYATKLRLTVVPACNAVAPGTTLTVGLYPVGTPSGGSGALNPNVGTVVSGSTLAFASGTDIAASSVGAAKTTGDITMPSSGLYIIGVVSAAAMTAASLAMLTAKLEYRNV